MPGATVPESAQREGDDQIAAAPKRAVAVAAERNVNVVPNPGAQRNVPARPEITQAGGRVGVIKIFRQTEPEHLGKTEGDVGVAAEIE